MTNPVPSLPVGAVRLWQWPHDKREFFAPLPDAQRPFLDSIKAPDDAVEYIALPLAAFHELAAKAAEAERFYSADGSFVTLPSDEVRRRRIEAAAKAARCERAEALLVLMQRAAVRAEKVESALRKIADYKGPVVCEKYETCHHESCDFGYYAQTLAADTIYGTTTEIGEARIDASREGRK